MQGFYVQIGHYSRTQDPFAVLLVADICVRWRHRDFNKYFEELWEYAYSISDIYNILADHRGRSV
jgi:hypothetical protein